VTEAPVVVIVLGYKNAYQTHLEPMLEQRVALGGLTPEAANEVRGRVMGAFPRIPDLATWALRSCMLAAMSMMIAAESLGVASAPMEGFDHGKIKEEFGVPDDHIVCCLVALGHRLEQAACPGRFGLNEVCYEEHFGQPWTLGETEQWG
jgi:nitroreductase